MTQARGIGLSSDSEPELVATVAATAEELGYASFWLNHAGRSDGVAALEPAARATAAIALGVGVVPLHQRPAQSIVDGVRRDGLPTDRLLVGVGSAGAGAFARAREGVSLIRAELGSAVVMGALSEAACRLAGEIADGVLFNWLTPEYARRSGAWVEAGADKAGRPRPRLYAYVRVAIGAGAGERIADEGARYAGGPYGPHFQRMEATPLETAVAAGSDAEVAEGLGRWEGAVDEVVLRLLPASAEAQLEIVRAGAPA